MCCWLEGKMVQLHRKTAGQFLIKLNTYRKFQKVRSYLFAHEKRKHVYLYTNVHGGFIHNNQIENSSNVPSTNR